MAVWASTFISSKILLLEGLQPLEIFFCRFLFRKCFLFCSISF